MFTKILWGIALSLLSGSALWAEGGRQKAIPIVPKAWERTYEAWGYAPALRVGDYIHASGVVITLDGEGTYEEQYARSFKQGLKTIESILQEAGASLDDVVEITSFHMDLKRQLPVAVKVRKEMMNKPHPAWTAVGTTELADPRGVTEIKVLAYRGD